MDLKLCKKLCSEGKVKWSQHCLERMQERDISREDVKNAVFVGEIIEQYPDDFPHPSCLILGYTLDQNVLHVVAGYDDQDLIFITTYFPTTDKFENDFKTRKE